MFSCQARVGGRPPASASEIASQKVSGGGLAAAAARAGLATRLHCALRTACHSIDLLHRLGLACGPGSLLRVSARSLARAEGAQQCGPASLSEPAAGPRKQDPCPQLAGDGRAGRGATPPSATLSGPPRWWLSQPPGGLPALWTAAKVSCSAATLRSRGLSLAQRRCSRCPHFSNPPIPPPRHPSPRT